MVKKRGRMAMHWRLREAERLKVEDKAGADGEWNGMEMEMVGIGKTRYCSLQKE
jgi:hypothetical protein